MPLAIFKKMVYTIQVPACEVHFTQTGTRKMHTCRCDGERGKRRLWWMQRPERVAAVDKIEEKRKPEDFIGHRNRIAMQ